jgi:exopolysaccharide production protein ExoY
MFVSDGYDAARRQASTGGASRLGHAAIRAVDVAIAGAALMFVAPLMLVVAVLLSIFDPGPIIFRHRRLGQNGRSFNCLKFRTMVVDSQARLEELLRTDPEARAMWQIHRKLKHDPRITALGRFLRKSSIDELPQLVNVLRGEMSIVGPRPIVEDEIAKYGRYFAHYSSVRPGITGLWQVSGRNDVSYRRRVAMDVVYARRKSLGLNMKIMGLTMPAVVLAKGCS